MTGFMRIRCALRGMDWVRGEWTVGSRSGLSVGRLVRSLWQERAIMTDGCYGWTVIVSALILCQDS